MKNRTSHQHSRTSWALALALLVFATACSEHLMDPETSGDPAIETASESVLSASKKGAHTCPKSPDFVATDEASLLAALGAATPGDVIALDGFFEVTADVLITTDDVTLTCRTPGSGLAAQPGAGVFDMVNALAKGVIVEGLVLDGAETGQGPYFAINDGASFTAENILFTNNTVTCGPTVCVFTVGVKGARISGNRFEAAGVISGVHLQGSGPFAPDGTRPRPIDGTRIERNTFVETVSSGSSAFGAIRTRDGKNVVIAHNDISGPWQNGYVPTNLHESEIAHNRIDTPVNFGVLTSLASGGILRVENNVFRNNRISGAGTTGNPLPFGFAAGMFLRLGVCGNVFVGNNLNGNADDLGAVFDIDSGANTLAGNQNVVEDNGDFDCDGDGVSDPNIITGSGAVQHGVNLGQIVSSAVRGDLE